MILRKILNYKTYDFYIEIDADCEELVEAYDLTYEQSKDDKTQIEIKISLDDNDFSDLLKNISFHKTNEKEISSYLLSPELGEYTTRVTFSRNDGDYISFY